MNPKLASKVYFTLQHLRKEPVKEVLEQLMESLNYNLSELDSLQTERTFEMLRHAVKNVPYYRDKYHDFRDQIMQSKSRDELKALMTKLPPLEKTDVLKEYDRFYAKNFDDRHTTNNITSGSSGNPLMFPNDNLSWAYRHGNIFRMLRIHGVEPGDPYGYFFGLHWNKSSKIKVHIKDTIFNRVRVSAFSLDQKNVRKAYKRLKAKGVNHLIGYPSALNDFCVLAEREGLDLKQLNLKCIMGTAEPLLPLQRQHIEAITGSRCIDQYGSVEGGPGAFEGREGYIHQFMEGSHLHVNEHNEIFTTDFHLFAFPLIKYRIGDFVSDWHATDRVLEAKHRLFGRVSGRTGESIELPNGRRINSNLPSYIFKGLAAERKILRYRFIHNKKTNILSLRVIPLTDDLVGLRQKISDEVMKAFGCSCNIEFVESLSDLPNAKHKDYITK